MNEKQTHLDWGFGRQWLVSCAMGMAIFGAAAYASMWSLAEAMSPSNELIGLWVAGAVFGALMALGGTLGPGLLLRRVGISAGRWIGYSVVVATVAMSIGVTLISSQGSSVQDIVSVVFVGLALGLPMGLVQSYLLKQQGLSAVMWPIITVVAHMLAFGIVVFFSGEGREWIVLGGMGLALGTITALGMMWVLRQDIAVAV